MDEEKLKLLYEAVSKDYSIGTYDEFSQKFADPTKRKAFYEGVGKEYELGSYQDFESKVTKTGKGYDQWKNKLPKRLQADSDYDLKGYYDKYGAVNLESPEAHLTDEFKKPNHPTFSKESKYSTGSNVGGEWVEKGDGKFQFVASQQNLDNLGEQGLRDYFKNNEPDVELVLPNQSKPSTAEDPLYETGQLEEVNITPDKEDKGFLSDAWNSLASGLNSVYSGLVDIPKMVYELAAVPQNLVADAFDIPSLNTDFDKLIQETGKAGTPLKALSNVSDFYRKQSKQYGEQVTKFEKGIYDSIKSGDFGNAGRQLGNQIIGSAPALAQLYVTGGAGNAAGLSAIGKTALNALPFAGNKLAEIEDNPNLKSYQKPIVATLNGLAEVVFEEAFGSKAILDGVIKNLREGATDVAERSVREFAEGYLKKVFSKNGIPVSFAKGGASEGITQFTQNFIKKYSGENPDTDLMEGVADAILVGGVMDSSIQGVGNLLSSIKNSKDKATATQLQEEITQLKTDLDKTGSEAVNDVLEQKTEELSTVIDNAVSKESKLTPEQVERTEELNTRAQALEDTLNDETLSEPAKQALTQELEVTNSELDTLLPDDSLPAEPTTTPVKIASEVNVGDNIVLERGKRGVVSSVDGGLVKIDLERGGTLTANPTLVEMSIEQNTEPVAQEDGVIDVSQPQEEVIPQEGEVAEPEIIVPEEVTTPTQDKLTEIQTRRAEIAQRLKVKLSNLNSGINPDALKDLVDLGATYIEEGVVRFKDFAERLKADLGKDLKDEDLRNIYKQSAEALGYGIRGFGERVRTDQATPEATQKALDETEQLYTRQDYGEIATRLAQMDDAEKQRLVGSLESVTAQLSSEQNIGVLAGIELINKYNAEGRTEEATKLIESLSKSATVAAQTLRQYGEFKTSTPDGYMQLIEKWMAKANKKLTEAQKEKIRELFLIQQQQSQRVTDALESVTENLDDDSFKEYYAAVIGYEDAIRNLEDYIDTARGKTLFDTLAKILQGNLLSLKSVVINPFANLVQFGVRTAENDAATAVDQVVKLITGRRTKSATLTAANLKLSGNAVKQGVSRANRKALRGTANSELSKYDVGGRLKPAVAWKRLFENLKSSDARVENQYGWEQGLSDFAEGTIGVPANIMFRLLPYGDDPFYEQARVQRLVEIGKNDKGLEGEALERFILKPDKDSSESAETYGREATFQEDNVISRNINRLINDGAKRVEALSGRQGAAAFRFVMKGILPFVNTPSSIAIKTVKFAVPAIPFAQAVNSAVQLRKAYKMNDSALKEKLLIRHQRDFANHMGEAIVSATVLGVATILVANGLATGDLPDDEYQKKQKNFMFATQPPNTLNISGVKRMLAGGSTAYEQGDVTISYVPLGLIGAQIGIVSSTQGSGLRDAKRKANVQTTEGKAYYPEADFNPLNFLGNFVTNAPAAMRYFFNQSFVQGAETVLNAVSTETGAKNIVPQLGKTFVTMGIPNTVSQAFRASNDYMRDLYTDDQLTTFANIIKEKVGAVEDLPIKYDLWGKPIKQTPDGSNPYAYQVLDIFRTQKILQDPITYAIFDIQRRSGDDGAVPSAVDDTFTKRDIKVKLNKEQKSELTKLVGEERRKNAERVLKSYVAGKSDTDKYIVRLKKAYEGGARRGLNRFKKENKIK